MSATSDVLPPLPKESRTRVNEDTNPPMTDADRTQANYGMPPGSLTQLSMRMFTFRPSPHHGDIGLLGRYRLLKQLGKGGMGAVYLGFDERLRRKVAIKVMNPDSSFDPESKERFLREARAAAQIAHDNVIDVFDADEADGIPYIAMQFLQGYPLDQYLAKKGIPSIPQVVRIGREMAHGLAAAHRLGLVHRDIKPGNIWLEAPNGRVKILDFGLARPVKAGGDGEITKSGAVVGTPAYMPPEQARGLKVDCRADLFSLGVVLYRLVTNRLPFDGPDMMAILTALAVEDPTPVWAINPDVPRPLGELIHELLSKKPEHRPQTADEVAGRLHSLAERVNNPQSGVPNSNVIYVPMPVTVHANDSNAFAELLEEPTELEAELPIAGTRRMKPPKGSRGMQIALMLGGIFTMLLGGFIIIKIVNADGTTNEIKVPDSARVTVDKGGKKLLDTGKKEPAYVAPINYAPFVKLDANWLKTVSALPPSDMLGPINEELKRRNPEYDGKGLAWVNDPQTGTNSAIELTTPLVSDLMPLLAIPNLTMLSLRNPPTENGTFRDSALTSLVPLKGLKSLRTLRLHGHRKLADLSPIENLPIEHLYVRYCAVESLAPLAKLKLEVLEIPNQYVRDFTPLANLPLRTLWFGADAISVDLSPLSNCPLEHLHIEWGSGMDLTPLKKCPLKSFSMVYVSMPDLTPLEGSSIEKFSGFDFWQYEPFLRKLPKLETVTAYNTYPKAKDDYFREFEKVYSPPIQAYKTRMANLPLEERIAAARKQFATQNGKAKAVFEVEIENGDVVGVNMKGSDPLCNMWSLYFLHAFPKLKRFDARDNCYTPLFHQIVDLPLEEIHVMNTWMHQGENLNAFAKMKSLKKINGVPFEQFAKDWNLFPSKPKAAPDAIDPDWVKRVSAMRSAEALAEVNAELKRRNPGFVSRVEQAANKQNELSPTHIHITSPDLVDLSPLLGLPNVENLYFAGAGQRASQFTDLGPLAQLRNLKTLELKGHAKLSDLSPLQDMSITVLNLYACNVSDLSPLRKLRLEDINIHKSPVRDLSPLRGMPLRRIWMGHPEVVQDLKALADCPLQEIIFHDSCGVDLAPLKACPLRSLTILFCSLPDLTPLEGSNLENVGGHNVLEHAAFLRTLPNLKTVIPYQQQKVYSKEQVLQMAEERQKATAKFVENTKNQPFPEQLVAVQKEFERLAAGQKYNYALEYENGKVVGFHITGSGKGSDLWDFSYLRVFPHLRRLTIDVAGEMPFLNRIVDLPLEEVELNGSQWSVHTNLWPLAQMKSMKKVNGQPIERFAKEWNFPPRDAKK